MSEVLAQLEKKGGGGSMGTPQEIYCFYDRSGFETNTQASFLNGNTTEYLTVEAAYKVRALVNCKCVRNTISNLNSAYTIADEEPIEYQAGEYIINYSSARGYVTVGSITVVE